MVVGELHGFMPVSSKMKSSTRDIFLSSPFFGRKLGNGGDAYTSISGAQLSKFNFPRKTWNTSRRLSTTTAVLADFTKDFMVTFMYFYLYLISSCCVYMIMQSFLIGHC